MAIVSKQETPRGYAAYWVIGRMDLDNFGRTATIKLLGFADKQFADRMDATPLETVEIDIGPDQYDDYFRDSDFLSTVYQLFTQNRLTDNKGDVMYDFTAGKRG